MSNNNNNNDNLHGTQNLLSVTQPDEILPPVEDDNNVDNVDELPEEDLPPDRTLLPRSMYVVFDLETDGLSRERNHIIEIAGQILDPLGNPYGNSFNSLVNPLSKISYLIQNITGITNDDLKGQPLFNEVASDFFKFIMTTIRQYEEENKTKMVRIVLVVSFISFF